MIATKYGDVREDRLIKRVDVVETDDHRVEAVEYCPIECHGLAHVRNEPFGAGCFCPFHVHRSVSVTVKRMPEFVCAADAARLE